MPLYVNTNTMSLNAQRNLTNSTNMLAKTLNSPPTLPPTPAASPVPWNVPRSGS